MPNLSIPEYKQSPALRQAERNTSMNNGNVSGQWVAFLQVVVGQLPRDLSWVDLDYLTQHPEVVGRVLGRMKEEVPPSFAFDVPIVYGRIEDIMKASWVRSTHPSISSAYVPVLDGQGTQKKKIRVWRHKLESCSLFMGLGCRPAFIGEVICATRIPLVKHIKTVAMGSVFCFEGEDIVRYPYTFQAQDGTMNVGVTTESVLRKLPDVYFATVEEE